LKFCHDKKSERPPPLNFEPVCFLLLWCMQTVFLVLLDSFIPKRTIIFLRVKEEKQKITKTENLNIEKWLSVSRNRNESNLFKILIGCGLVRIPKEHSPIGHVLSKLVIVFYHHPNHTGLCSFIV
jgi:hypothetical protein